MVIESNLRDAMERVHQAATGQCGDDQRHIAAIGLELVAMLLRKNTDYGGSAWQCPLLAPGLSPRLGMQCRMSDKIQRLARLLDGRDAQVNESVTDTFRDLAGYIILWLGAEH